MVSQATIQAKIDHGFAIAASKLGVTCDWYRPTGANAPLSAAAQIGTLQVLLDTNPGLGLRTPRRRDKPEEWYAAFDTSGVAIGDYLVTPQQETYFITVMDAFSPARLALCNRVLTITNPAPMAAFGINAGYGGDIKGDEVPVAAGWPACVVKGARGETGDVKLPGDAKLAWLELLLPPMPGVTLRNDMIASYPDETGEAFRVILVLAELTSLGWRCTGVMETA